MHLSNVMVHDLPVFSEDGGMNLHLCGLHPFAGTCLQLDSTRSSLCWLQGACRA